MANSTAKPLADAQLNWLKGSTLASAFTSFAANPLVTVYVGLYTTTPTTNANLGGTEVSGSSYARQPITCASLWTAAGNPGAGAAQGSAAGAVPTSVTAGALPFTNPTSGNSYLARLFASSTVPGTLILYDRLVHTSTLSGTVTTAQTVASVALTRPDALGTNTELFMEAYTALGATSNTITSP